MPAQSKAQRRMFALALQYKRGELKDDEVSDKIKELSKMPEKSLKDYAETPEKDLPDHVEEGVGMMTGGGVPYGHEFVSARRREDMQLNYIKKDKAEEDAEDKPKPKQHPIKRTMSFDEWKKAAMTVQEDAGAASGMNTPGMGNVTPPGEGTLGSGDTFGSLAMNYEDWKKWKKMAKKNQKGKKEKPKPQTQVAAWELGGRLHIPVVNVYKS